MKTIDKKRLLLIATLIQCYYIFSGSTSVMAAEIIYVTTTGSGSGAQNDPAQLISAISSAASGDIIRIGMGTYTLNQAIANIPSGVTLEGGFDPGDQWSKTSLPGATTLYRSALNPEGTANQQRLVAMYANGSTNFRLQDLTIETADAPVSAAEGISTYGAHLTNCSDYYFLRVHIISGNAGKGADGTKGRDGSVGSDGSDGMAGAKDGQSLSGSGGDGGNGGGTDGANGGTGGPNPPGCCRNGSTGTSGSAASNRGGSGGGEAGSGGTGGYSGGGSFALYLFNNGAMEIS
jgi:hypothetical protein